MNQVFLENTPSNIPAEDLFRQYYTRLCHFAFQLLGEKGMAEDIAQDAFIAYWNNQGKVSDNPGAVKNFLYTSVRNACYNLHRHSKVQERYLQIHNNDDSEEPQVLHAMIRAEVMNEIYTAIQTLPPNCQRIFRMGYLEGLTNSEIAETLGISINTVKTQKNRGLKILRANLNPEVFLLLTLLKL